MQLWDTPNGDKWLCEECKAEIKEQISKEEWRMVFDRLDPMLRCAICGHCDIEIED